MVLKKQQEDYIAELKRKMDEQMNAMTSEEQVKRLFAINSFGVYNCDNPSVYPRGVSCSANLKNEKNVNIWCYEIYLVDKKKNAMYTFEKNPINSFSFNPESKNMLWTVENGVLYWMKPEQFSDIKSSDGTKNFIMNRVDKKFTTVDELKAFLSF